jgi:cob(I)alamin adenosyltransferase
MISVSTKTGDKGESGLASGERMSKDELIFEVLGTQDELNSWIGVVIANLSGSFPDHHEYLLHIQDTLFYMGADIARSPKVKFKEEELSDLEKHSDELQDAMGENWTTKFLYPGGNQTAAFLDVARTVCRRLERLIVRYSKETEVSPVILRYINRLSDYLFVLRCFINSQEKYDEKKFETNGTYKRNILESESSELE